MEYMTEQLMQRFMANMTDDLSWLQSEMKQFRGYAIKEGIEVGASSKVTRESRDKLSRLYSHSSRIQTSVKYFPLKHSLLQQMEKRVTLWIKDQQDVCNLYYEAYLESRYDTFYRNRTSREKKKLAKLVELQQAIRKQKSVNHY